MTDMVVAVVEVEGEVAVAVDAPVYEVRTCVV
jgi:hypothetical protein